MQKVVHALHKNTTRGTHSERRNTLIPKKAQNVQNVQTTNYSSEKPLYSKETKPGLTNSLSSDPSFSQLQPVAHTSHSSFSLTTSLFLSLSQPVHGERNAFLAVTRAMWQAFDVVFALLRRRNAFALSMIQRRCPSQGFSGNRISTCLLDQETDCRWILLPKV